MKSSEIKVGSLYKNKGAGRILRRVFNIGNDYRPQDWAGFKNQPPNEPGVEYETEVNGKASGIRQRLYLSSFAAWAGAEVLQITQEVSQELKGKPTVSDNLSTTFNQDFVILRSGAKSVMISKEEAIALAKKILQEFQ